MTQTNMYLPCLLMHRSFTSERAAADAPSDRKECRPKFKFGSTDLSFCNIFSLADVELIFLFLQISLAIPLCL